MTVVLEIDLTPLSNLLSKFNIGHLLLLSLSLHLLTIPFPGDAFVMDEIYWVVSARHTLLLEASSIEHPPLARILIAISMRVFGDYWFAWRFPIVLTAIGSLYVFYLIAKRFVNERSALFATAILSFDVIFFVHGSLAYLEMPTIFFGLIGMELYFAKRYNWSAFSFGISFLMKELGLLFLAAIAIHHIATHLKIEHFRKKANLKKVMTFFLVLLLIGGGGLWLYEIVYQPTTNLLSQPVTIWTVVDQNGNPTGTEIIQINNSTRGTQVTNPIQWAMLIWSYNTGGKTSGFLSRGVGKSPWSWIMPVEGSLLPVHYYYAATPASATVDWQLEITPFVEYFLIPIIIVAFFSILRKKDENRIAVFLLSWITAGYGPFLLTGIIVPDWTTVWHYNYVLYVIPALALGIPYVWQTLIRNRRIREAVMAVQLVLAMMFFLFFFPIPLIR